MAQKRGLKLPIYETLQEGPPRKPIIVSIVEIGSDTFRGTEAKTKKQAEMNVAEMACVALTEKGERNAKRQKTSSEDVNADMTGSSTHKHTKT
ncbi:Hypothetical predicted protein [Olea europaea subsp. europaea]|uniref:DRBM domain-containing protein n=1 Tax=Olea europaea subsp. europaea TaxID=158383 RepID=A0A8S0S3H7_OLEEU|nr:Hypothetical predicted protein [Olea europaea subsp. europaea]